jgi:lysophospholipid acyltransferase (LPLAT)-like uncharacterized protein
VFIRGEILVRCFGEGMRVKVSPAFLARIIAPLVRLWGKTLRVRFDQQAELEELRRSGGVVVIWHSQLMLLAWYFRDLGFRPLISQHRDGELAAQVAIRLGYRPVRGSSTRGGDKAIWELKRLLDQGEVAVLVADGPKGPARRFKEGFVFLGAVSGKKIYPAVFACDRAWTLNSWDRFQIVKPFGRVAIRGVGLSVPPVERAELGPHREAFERRMEEVEAEARGMLEEAEGG